MRVVRNPCGHACTLAASVDSGHPAFSVSDRLVRILLCDRECAYGGTRRFLEQPGIRHGDCDASACVHRVEVNRKYRHRGYDNCDCDWNGHLHHRGDGGGQHRRI